MLVDAYSVQKVANWLSKPFDISLETENLTSEMNTYIYRNCNKIFQFFLLSDDVDECKRFHKSYWRKQVKQVSDSLK